MSVFTKKPILIICIAFGLLILACGDDATGPGGNAPDNDFVAYEPFDFQFDVANQTRLSADAVNAVFNIIGVEGSSTVSITGEKSVASSSMEDAEAHLQFLLVNATDRGNEILIESDQPDDTGGRDYNVEFDIEIPRDFDVIITAANGIANVGSMDGDVSISMANGQVALDEIAGNTSVNLANGIFEGDIELPLNGLIDIVIANGTINLAIPQTTSAEFSAVVVNGSISITNLTLFDEVITPTSVTGTLGSGEGTIDLNVANGLIFVGGY